MCDDLEKRNKGETMKRVLASLLVTFALMLTPCMFAQDGGNVTVDSNQQGNSVSFSVTNTTGGTVCVFPYVVESSNVYGSVVSMIQLEAGDSNVYIGAYAQFNSAYAWYVQVSAKWRKGTCA